MLSRAADMAKELCVSPFTLKRWARLGLIPAVNLRGGLWLFDPDKVVAALESMGGFASRLPTENLKRKEGRHVV